MDFATLKKMQDDYTKAMKKHGKAALIEEFKSLFEKFSEVKAVTWVQYTPGFNDGDPCVFGVHYRGVITDDLTEEDEDEGDYNYGTPAYKAFEKVVDGAPEELMKICFGDGAKVTVYRDGKVDCDEYDCGY